jgi:hypothetical protein
LAFGEERECCGFPGRQSQRRRKINILSDNIWLLALKNIVKCWAK